MKRMNVVMALAAGMVLTGAAAAMGESIWVQSDNVEIRQGKGAVYPVVGNAPKGTELTVILRDGKWIEVQSGTMQGWVYETATSAQQVSANKGGLGGVQPGMVKVDTNSAAKGLTPTAENYAAGKQLSSAPLNQLIAANHRLDPKEWEQFTQEGKVGPNKQ